MIVAEYREIELDICPECRGVWFDSEELELMLGLYQMEGPDTLFGDIRNKPQAETGEKKRRCPICGQMMVKKNIGDEEELLIDTCGSEHGMWFDAGEVARLYGQITGSDNKAVNFLEEFFNFSG
jgi:Zn-finger nucleic acid-binding protein